MVPILLEYSHDRGSDYHFLLNSSEYSHFPNEREHLFYDGLHIIVDEVIEGVKESTNSNPYTLIKLS